MLLTATGMPMRAASGQVIDGYTEPFLQVDVAAEEMGALRSLSTQEGDRVEAGQILAQLDQRVLSVTLQIAQQTAKNVGRLKSAEAELSRRLTLLKSMLDLQSRQNASQIEVDRAQTDVEIARSQLVTVQEELEIRRLECARIEAQLESRRIRSPIRGIVVGLAKEVGEYVSANDPVVATVVQLNPLVVRFSVSPHHAKHISKGATVALSLGANAAPCKGTVDFVSPIADASSDTVQIKVLLPNPGNKIQSGQVCRLIIGDLPLYTQKETSRLGRQPVD